MTCKINFNGNTYSQNEFKEFVANNPESVVDNLTPDMVSKINTNKFYSKNTSQGTPGEVIQLIQNSMNGSNLQTLGEFENEFGVPMESPTFKDLYEREAIHSIFNQTNKSEYFKGLLSQQLVNKPYDTLSPAVKSLFDAVSGQKNNSNVYPTHNELTQSVVLDKNNEFKVIENSEIENFIDTESGPNLLLKIALDEIADGQYNNTTVNLDAVLDKTQKNELQSKLLGILGNLGVKVTSISNYIKNYNQKYGIDPSVEALSDITQRVVALSETGDIIDNLSEEVSHFLVEAYNNQDEISAVLPLVETSNEWAEHSSHYFTLYENQGFSDQSLTDKVRREVLGKIVSNSIITRETSSLYDRALGFISNFVSSVQNYFSPNIRTSLNDIVSRITESALNEKQFNDVFSEGTLNSSNFDIFYSTKPSTLTNNLNSAVSLMQKQLAVLQKEGTGKGLNLRMESLKKNVEASDTLKSVSTYLDMVDTIYTDVNRKVKNAVEASKKGQVVGPILMGPQAASAHILTTENLAHLSTLKDDLLNYEFSDPKDKEISVKLIVKLNQYSIEIQALGGQLKNLSIQQGEEMMDSLMVKFRIPDHVKVLWRKQLNGLIRDTNMLMANFGNMQNASNPILLLLSKMVNSMYSTVRTKELKVFNALHTKVKDLGMLDKLGKLFQRDSDGKLTNYFSSAIDFAKFDKNFESEKVRLYNEALQKDPVLSVLKPVEKSSEIGQSDYPSIVDLEDSIRRDYNDKLTQWFEDNTETPYNGSFKKLKEDMFKAIEQGVTLPDGTIIAMTIPDVVKQQMAEWARRRREIKEPYIVNGIVDFSLMSDTERAELVTIKKERKSAASMIDPGSLEEKTGTELEVAKSYQAMNAYYANQSNGQNTRGVVAGFFDALSNFTTGKQGAELAEANRKAFEFFNKNSGLNFNQNFWEAVKSNNLKVSEKVEEYLAANTISIDEQDLMRANAFRLEKLLSNRSSFLKQFSNPANPAEVDVESMSKNMLDSFKDLEQEIESLYSDLNTRLSNEGGLPPLIETESTANEAYLKVYEEALKLQPALSEMDFMLNHMTVLNKNKVSLFAAQFREYSRTGIIPITGNFKFVTTKLLGLDPKATNSEISSAIATHQNSNGESLDNLFAKSKLLGYFKRYAPKGYGEFYDMLKSGEIRDINGNSITLSEIIADIEVGKIGANTFEFMGKNGKPINIGKYMSVNPEVEWMEDQNPFTTNPNYIKNTPGSQHLGGSRQPNITKYRNDKFISEYNIDMQVYTSSGKLVSNGTSTDKLNELEALSLITERNFENLSLQGLQNTENSFKRSQVRKSNLEQYGNLTKGNLITKSKNILRDSWSNTVDKMLYGETISGDINSDGRDISNLSVPIMNVRDIEDLTDVTEDVLYGLMTHTHNAILYKERQKVLAQSNQLEQLMLKQQFIGKDSKNSKAYKWFQDYRKINLLGVSELNKVEIPLFGKAVNITNLLRGFDSFSGTVNVGLNPAVSITSGTSAFTFSATEALLEDYITSESYKWGGKRFAANQVSFLSETGKVEKTSEVYLLGEKFGLFNLTDRLNGAGYNQALRAVFKDGLHGAAHTLTEMMTHPYAPTAMYGVMHDFRYVSDTNGTFKLMNFNEFRSQNIKQYNTQKELKTAWCAFEDNSIAKNVTTENGVVGYSDNFKNIWNTIYQGDTEAITEEIEFMENAVTSGTENLVSKIDAKMPMYDKSTASRNALLRFVLRHREWFSINMQNRWKGRHYNANTFKDEEGSYISLSTYLRDIYKAFEFKGGLSNFKEFKKIYDTLDHHQQKNLQRVLLDSAISVLLILAGSFLVAPMVDDDENKDNWLIQYAGYMYFRLSSEQMSSGLSGIPQAKDVVEAPFVAVNSMKELMKPSNYSFKEVDRGVYEGHSKLFKLIAKQTPVRHYFDTVYGVNQKSDFFRLNNEWTLWGMGKISKKEKEEKEAYEKELANTFSGPDRPGMR